MLFVCGGIAVYVLCGDCRLCVGRRLWKQIHYQHFTRSHHFTRSLPHTFSPPPSYYFQAYTPKTAVAPASHKHLHHWVFLIDANVNDYEEDNADYGHASIGKISAHLTARNMGLEDTPASFGEIIPLVMTRTLQRAESSME